jgi:hypothetical protein
LLFAPVAALPGAPGDAPEFHTLDLSGCITKTWRDFRPAASWNPPAGGLQVFDGVPFQVDGVIQFRSTSPRAPEDQLPLRAKVIRVGRRFTRLHLFHFSEFSGPAGEPVAKFILHGVDGKDAESVVRYDIHLQDWSHFPRGPVSQDPNTHCAWAAPNRDEPDNPWLTMLWHTMLPNPRPDVEVASLEVRSLLSQVRYTLAAVTTESGAAADPPEPQSTRPTPRWRDVEPTLLRFHLADAEDGSPVAGARVQALVGREGQWAPFDVVETDAQGEGLLEFLSRSPRIVNAISGGQRRFSLPSGLPPGPIELVAAGANHLPAKLLLPSDPQRTPTLKLHRGQTVGGKVVDETGRGVAGAVVTISGPQDDGSGDTFFARSPDALTDTNGVWSLGCAPPGFSRLIVTVRDSKLLPAVISG